jgi:hypothetical protein
MVNLSGICSRDIGWIHMTPDRAVWKAVLKMINLSSSAFAEVHLRTLLLRRGVTSLDVRCPTFRDSAAISVLC